ncbi:MAG: serine/threonine protein kinase [Nocardioides sp.]|nr:serine/threonine protein kinase [Nocardioides sp.]
MSETTGGEELFADDARRYRLDSRIATGGMGQVWRATDTLLGRQVAVKVLKAELADDSMFRTRFETEARNAAALHHPGIAAVFDVGEKAPTSVDPHPRPYLVMELVEGQPLSALLTDGRELDPAAVRLLLAQVGEALGAAHRAGIVHRDVKPANLIVTEDQTVKVTDFGIARAADAAQITRTGAVMGTPQYLSPEQAEGKPATAASDVYALGVVAFECLAGRRPFDAESPVATALAHVREPVPDLPDSVPDDLAGVVRRAMAKNPSERYADGAAFAAALRDPSADGTSARGLGMAGAGAAGAAAGAAAGLGAAGAAAAADDNSTQVLPVGGPAPTPDPTGPVTTSTTTTPAQRSNPWPVVAAVVLVVALAVVLTLLLTGGDDEEPAADTATTSETPSETETTTEPTEETSTAEESVQVNEGDYVGQPIDQVEADLQGLGLQVERNAVDNANPDVDGLVTAVNPSGAVQPGSVVTVTFWGEAPETPTEEPTTETPTEEPTTELPTEVPTTDVPTASDTLAPSSPAAATASREVTAGE